MALVFFTRISDSWRNMEDRLNAAVTNSVIGKYFKLEARKTCFTRELRAASTTFLAMAYTITIIATILSESGGTCTVSDCSPPPNTIGGEDCRSKANPGYENCIQIMKNELTVAVSLSAMIGCFLMGVLANMPFGLAPGTGQAIYMTFNLVGLHGSGQMKYEDALAIWLSESILFIIVAASGLRAKLARFIPMPVRLACALGIGMFMTFIGLQTNQGLGLIGPDPSSLVTITACAQTDPATGRCLGGKLESPTFWLGSAGFLIMSYGLMNDVKGSMIYGILFVTFISWFRGTPVTYFPATETGEARYDYFKKIVNFHSISRIVGKISFSKFKEAGTWASLFTLLYIDLLATTGGLYTLAEIGGYVDDEGNFENEYMTYMVDAIATVIGSFLGVPPVSTYSESSTGIREGGRTGLTAVIIGVYFLLSLFLAPLLTSVPPWAIGPSLVMVGVILMKVAKDIDWGNIREAIPAFVTMMLMPLTSSIPNGIIGGIGVYAALHLYDCVVWVIRKVRRMFARETEAGESSGAAAAADSLP